MCRLGFFALFVATNGEFDLTEIVGLKDMCATLSPIASEIIKEQITNLVTLPRTVHIDADIGLKNLIEAGCDGIADDDFSDDDKTKLQKSLFHVIEVLGVEFIADPKILDLKKDSKVKVQKFIDEIAKEDINVAEKFGKLTYLIDQLPEVKDNTHLQAFMPLLHAVAGKNLEPKCKNPDIAKAAADLIAEIASLVWKKFQNPKSSDSTTMMSTLLPKILSNILSRKIRNYLCPSKEELENARKEAEEAQKEQEKIQKEAENKALKEQNAQKEQEKTQADRENAELRKKLDEMEAKLADKTTTPATPAAETETQTPTPATPAAEAETQTAEAETQTVSTSPPVAHVEPAKPVTPNAGSRLI